MVVVLLVVVVWAVVVIPPAVRSHAARREAFLLSFGPAAAPELPPPPPPPSQRVQCRRRIAGGLLVAMAATLVIGLLPTFRVLLVVHLFLLDSFLAYVALLAHMANRAARDREQHAQVSEQAHLTPRPPRFRRRPVLRPALSKLGQIAPAG